MPIQIETDARCVVTALLDNPSTRNALDDGMLLTLATLLEELASGSRPARALVIRGSEGCFCSGRDLGMLETTDPSAPASRLEPINRLARGFRNCPIPIIALVQGKAAGLGVSLVCWSDIAIATEDATFAIPEARAGIAPSVTAVSLIEVLGRRRALDLCLTGRAVNAVAAGAIGLVQHTVATEEVVFALESALDSLIRGAPGALRLTKELAREAEGKAFEVSLAAANATAERALAADEMIEGLKARREKRPPAWYRSAGA